MTRIVCFPAQMAKSKLRSSPVKLVFSQFGIRFGFFFDGVVFAECVLPECRLQNFVYEVSFTELRLQKYVYRIVLSELCLQTFFDRASLIEFCSQSFGYTAVVTELCSQSFLYGALFTELCHAIGTQISINHTQSTQYHPE